MQRACNHLIEVTLFDAEIMLSVLSMEVKINDVTK